MPGGGHTGLVVAGIGAALVVAGLLVWAGGLSWFGRLPGDIRLERDSFRFYFPVVSLIILSLALNLLIVLARKLMR